MFFFSIGFLTILLHILNLFLFVFVFSQVQLKSLEQVLLLGQSIAHTETNNNKRAVPMVIHPVVSPKRGSSGGERDNHNNRESFTHGAAPRVVSGGVNTTAGENKVSSVD